MRIENARKAFTIAFLEKKSLELVGWYGIGKSSLVRQFVEYMATLNFTVPGPDGDVLKHKAGEPVGLVECLIPTFAAEEIRGFPMPDYDAEEMFYSVPPMFPSKRSFPDGVPKFGVIFLDEYRLGTDDVVKATTQLLLEGRMGNHSLSSYGHWVVFAASNREEDRLGIGKEPPIITQRKMVLNLEPSIAQTVQWMEDNEQTLRIPAAFRFFAKENPSVVLSMKTPDTGEPFCTPRTLAEAAQICLRYMEITRYRPKNKFDIPTEDDLLLDLMGSKIGVAAAAQMQSYAGMIGQVPAYEDIMADPKMAPLPDPERMDAAYVTITVIEYQAGDYSRVPDGQQPDIDKLDHEIDALVTYLMRLPKEFQVVGLTRTFAKCPAIYSHPKVREIALKNPSVLKAISGTS